MINLTPAQADMLEAVACYCRAYGRGPDYDELRVLTGASDLAIGDMIFELVQAGLIERHGARFVCTKSGHHMIFALALPGTIPSELVNRISDNVRPRFGSCEWVAARSGSVVADTTFEALP